jgi:DNA repair protein RecO (recombination protein O)
VSAARAHRFHGRLLVLRRFPFGESSLVVHALTPDSGRIALLAKGAFRPTSGFFAVFDLFHTLEARWNARADQELGLVTRAVLLRRRAELSSDLETYRAALGLLELANATAREGHEERSLFGWLEEWLEALQNGAPARLVALTAGLALLRANGLAPALTSCASCGTPGRERSGAVPFSTASGGRLCAPCAERERSAGRTLETLSLNLARVAASLMDSTPATLTHTRLEPELARRLQAWVDRFLTYHLDTRLLSR